VLRAQGFGASADQGAVGLDDRGYMRDVPIYRQLSGRARSGNAASPEPRREIVRTRPWAWVLLGVIATLGVIALVTPVVRHGRSFPRLTSASAPVRLAAPPPSPLPVHVDSIRGPKTIWFGGRLILTGTSSAPGDVTVLGRWNHGPWELLAVGRAEDRRYHFVVEIERHGTLELRIVRPDGTMSQGGYRVVERDPGAAA